MTTINDATAARSATDVLAACRDLGTPALRAAVDSMPGSMRHITGYHLGWWDADGEPTDADSGKALRPALVLCAAEAVGGDPAEAIPAAVAVELVHNFSLLHDDVIDGDLTRRHRPTAWTVFGTSAAILAGDSALTLAMDVLAAAGHPAAEPATRLLAACVQELIDGQGNDIAFEARADVTMVECLRMVEAKTGALLAASCTLGALFGRADQARAGRLGAFGRHLGVAFQSADDLLGVWGVPAVTGKPVHSDLVSHKKSLPVVAALTSGTQAGRDLADLYAGDTPLTDEQARRAAGLIDLAGGRTWAEQRAEDELAAALNELAMADPVPRAAAELGALARLATRRDH
ncbi:Octaprenyl diphosphate synthase / Dimethylallyltransferase / (2E,6E)-farnesyl diphosphate synthase / Geranylgeranyl pyrophosphate synthetase [Alloactinosynnema sp. L-07]|uniref:family 2 encapsulin nanocompartment cargo protein polyprenyl transferase n=1 Tax=Alloactinosynnema sp. L-07 TaxID=1653480 RepID=UPI00065EF787|nr:family 2 encapsulin nanocompartment cargo protein polyprenyl transferase [Alloactinosynnema sp. L-07]CRK56065.1 Octaprenyl diphosphate synthase / Dimethylallyltransferase / (2E,6E)-farnesyl diphosphate synthase / Geranylgeranyl pyrophosphate synthetase [Alloactinosynnema sp. L-07]